MPDLTNLLNRARIQLDQWDRVEGGEGPELEHLKERCSTLIEILRCFVAADEDEKDLPLCPFCRSGAIKGERYQGLLDVFGSNAIEAALEELDQED